MQTLIPQHKVEELETKLEDLGEIENAMTYSLSDAIREGSMVSDQKIGGWVDNDGENMCALSAALTAVQARHFL